MQQSSLEGLHNHASLKAAEVAVSDSLAALKKLLPNSRLSWAFESFEDDAALEQLQTAVAQELSTASAQVKADVSPHRSCLKRNVGFQCYMHKDPMWGLSDHPHWLDRVARIQAKGYTVEGWGKFGYQGQHRNVPAVLVVQKAPLSSQQLLSSYQQSEKWLNALDHNSAAGFYLGLARQIRSRDPDLLAYMITNRAALKYDAVSNVLALKRSVTKSHCFDL